MWTVLLVLLSAHVANTALHSLQYYYTAVTSGIDFPEYTVVAMMDEKQFVYYDNKIYQMIPKTDWIKNNVGEDYWKRENQIHNSNQENFKQNLGIAMQRFNHTKGVHTFQRMYGCEWDDQTGATNAFKQYGYDGEDFLSLDFKEMRYISPVQQGSITIQKWNNDKGMIENDRNYYSTVCIEWLQKYLQYGKSSLEKTVSPKVSLLQKSSSSPVSCHATGFYPSGVTITWQKDGQDHDEDVDLGEIVPNEDGTFQVTSTLNVKPEEWKKNEYKCVVEHKRRTTRSILTEKEIITNYESIPIGIIVGVVAVVLLLVIIGVAGYFVYQKRKGFKPVNASDDGSNSSTRTDPHA